MRNGALLGTKSRLDLIQANAKRRWIVTWDSLIQNGSSNLGDSTFTQTGTQ